MLDLAVIQLIAGILVTLGSTLLAISIGFGLTIPTTLRQTLGEIALLKLDGIAVIEQELLQTSISNYVLLLAVSGILLIIVGVVYASAKMNIMKRRIRKERVRIRKTGDLPPQENLLSGSPDEISEA